MQEVDYKIQIELRAFEGLAKLEFQNLFYMKIILATCSNNQSMKGFSFLKAMGISKLSFNFFTLEEV